MLKTVLSVTVLFLSATIHAQAYKDSIRNQFLDYSGLLSKKELAKSMDYMNPGIFRIIPKDQLLAGIEQAYNNPEMDFEVEMPTITAVEDSKVINGQHYAKLRYSGYLKMRFVDADGGEQDTAMLKGLLQGQFGENNVTYDAATGFYRILAQKKVIANSPDARKWTFAVVEEKQKPLLEKFIPKELL